MENEIIPWRWGTLCPGLHYGGRGSPCRKCFLLFQIFFYPYECVNETHEFVLLEINAEERGQAKVIKYLAGGESTNGFGFLHFKILQFPSNAMAIALKFSLLSREGIWGRGSKNIARDQT